MSDRTHYPRTDTNPFQGADFLIVGPPVDLSVPTDFTPEDACTFPLPGAFNSAEAEVAAFTLVSTICDLRCGWRRFLYEEEVERTMRHNRYVRRVLSNPFYRFGIDRLESVGAVSYRSRDSVYLLPKFFERLRPFGIRGREQALDYTARCRMADDGGPIHEVSR